MAEPAFDHERLDVYRLSIDYGLMQPLRVPTNIKRHGHRRQVAFAVSNQDQHRICEDTSLAIRRGPKAQTFS
jgi:hypothetical protein